MSLKVGYGSRFEDLEIQVGVEKLQVLENKLGEEFDQQIWSKLQEQNVATNTQIAEAFRKNPNFSAMYAKQQERYYQQEKEKYVQEQKEMVLSALYLDEDDCPARFKSIRLLYTSFGQYPDLDEKIAYIAQYFDQNDGIFSDESGISLARYMYSLLEEHQLDRLRFELDWLFVAEQDCEDKERFRTSLANELLEKKEQREDIQTFVNHMRESKRKRDDLWSFIAYEFGPEHVERLHTDLERFVVAEQDCENKERFRRVLAEKLLDKEDQWTEIQSFIKNIESSIGSREKMRIFIAYYFDAQRYQDDPEQCLRQARLMINAPEPTAPKIDENNFYLATYAEFQKKQPSDLPQKAPDFISYAYSYDRDEDAERYIRRLTDRISSEYWYTEEGVFRRSDHRGPRIRRCSWELVDLDSSQQDDEYEEQDDEYEEQDGRIQVGFCSRKNFEDKRNFSLSDDLYWETGDEKKLPTIPLEFLGKGVKTFEFDEVGWSQIQDLGAPLDEHPNHYADDVTILLSQQSS